MKRFSQRPEHQAFSSGTGGGTSEPSPDFLAAERTRQHVREARRWHYFTDFAYAFILGICAAYVAHAIITLWGR